MTKPDLHTHSTFSDGVLASEMLVEKAAALGVTMMAITDHDTFDGADCLRSVETAIPVIPGVELSLRDMHGLHLLGYGLGEAKKLRDVVACLAAQRVTRAESMVRRLADMGMPLDWAAMTAGCAGTVGRAHIARAMLAKGYVHTMQEAFERYIGEGKPAYVEGERLSMAEALSLMRSCGFVPVLAHPAQLDKDDMTLRTLLWHWKDQGLMGLEAYHPCQVHRADGYDRLARSMSLMVTGGSDYHKDGDNHGQLGCTASLWRRAEEDMALLWQTIEKEKDAGM